MIHAIHTCAIKFSEVAASVVGLLMDFISDFNNSSAVDVIAFVKEVVEKFPALRSSIIERLMGTLGEVRAGKVYRGALWIVGEYCVEQKGNWLDLGLSFWLVKLILSLLLATRYPRGMETDSCQSW